MALLNNDSQVSEWPKILEKFLPRSQTDFLCWNKKPELLGSVYTNLLTTCVSNLYEYKYQTCIDVCKVLLDITWEKLNTGYWKNVPLEWRLAYYMVSLCKAASEFCLALNQDSSISYSDIIRSCDMGILMGAPFMSNVLADLASYIHETYISSENCDPLESANLNYAGIEIQPPYGDSSDKIVNLGNNNSSYKSQKKMKISHSLDYKKEVIRFHCPSLECFRVNFKERKCPVIITGAIDYWPAFTTRCWSLDYIKKVAGQRLVPVELGKKYTEESWSQTLMTIADFVKTYIDDSEATVGYLAQHQLFEQIKELKKDISVPTYCCLGDSDDVEIHAWFGPNGTVSPLHHDPKHNFLCQALGEKYIRLYAETVSECLYPHEDYLLANTSQVDMENPDYDNFPRFRDTPYTECILKPGEMLYMPPKHWHFVKSLSTSFSVSFWWE